MAEFERIEVGRHVLGPGDTLVIRVKSGTTRVEAEEFRKQLDADGRLKDRVMIIAAEQFVIVRSDEKTVHVA